MTCLFFTIFNENLQNAVDEIFYVFCDVLLQIVKNYFLYFMLFSNVVHAVPICGGLMLWKQHFTSYRKHKRCRIPVKKMSKFNKQQINNELRPNDFNKAISITQKTKRKDTPPRAN